MIFSAISSAAMVGSSKLLLQSTMVALNWPAEGAPIEVAQALRRDSRERRFRSHPQQ
jgi:hypothetical protein